MPAYRDAARRCEMCQAEEPASLESYAGLQICPTCRTEDFQPGLRAWGLKLYTYDEEKGGPKHKRREYNASAVLPTVIDLGDVGAVMRAERFDTKIGRFFGKTDPSMGSDAFDKKVWVERIEGDLIKQLALQRSGGVSWLQLHDGLRSSLQTLQVSSELCQLLFLILLRRTSHGQCVRFRI